MPEFVYEAFDGHARFFEGPESAPDPELLVARARSRGHRPIQLFWRQDGAKAFLPLFDSPYEPLPLTMRAARSRWWPLRRRDLHFGPSDWQGLQRRVQAGELRASPRWWSQSMDISTDSVMRMARQNAESVLRKAISNAEAQSPLTEEQVEARKRESQGPESDIEELKRTLGEDRDNSPEEIRNEYDRAGCGETELQTTRSGIRVPLMRIGAARQRSHGFDFLLEFAFRKGEEFSPCCGFLELVVSEAIRRNFDGFKFFPMSRAESLLRMLRFPGGSHLRLLGAGVGDPSQDGPPLRMMDDFADLVVAAAGDSPFETPPFSSEREVEFPSGIRKFRVVRGLTVDGPTIELTWSKVACDARKATAAS